MTQEKRLTHVYKKTSQAQQLMQLSGGDDDSKTEVAKRADGSITVHVCLSSGEEVPIKVGLYDNPVTIAAEFVAIHAGVDTAIAGPLELEIARALLKEHQSR